MTEDIWIAKINNKSMFFGEEGESFISFMCRIIVYINGRDMFDNKYLIEVYKEGEEDKLYK